MTDHVYKHIEVTGTSAQSYGQAIENAVEKAATTIKHMRWFQVIDSRGHIESGKVSHWQATIKIGFTLQD